MGLLIIALIPILQGLFAGAAVSAVLGGLTLAQWAALAAAIATLAATPIEDATSPEVIAQLQKLHPVLSQLMDDCKNFGPEKAASNAYAFDFENPNMPGMMG